MWGSEAETIGIQRSYGTFVEDKMNVEIPGECDKFKRLFFVHGRMQCCLEYIGMNDVEMCTYRQSAGSATSKQLL